jgi:hypothetical protein
LAQRSDLQKQVDDLPIAQGATSLNDLERAAELLNNFDLIWQAATLEERKELFQLMVNKIWIFDGGLKAVEPTSMKWVLLSTVLIPKAGRTGA